MILDGWKLRCGEPSASAHWEEGGLNKERMAFTSFFIQENLAFPVLTWKPDNSISLAMSLVPFNLLLHRWGSEQVSLSASKFMHGPFKTIT